MHFIPQPCLCASTPWGGGGFFSWITSLWGEVQGPLGLGCLHLDQRGLKPLMASVAQGWPPL